MRHWTQGRVLDVLRHLKQPRPHLQGYLILRMHEGKRPQALQRGEKLWGVTELGTQFARPGVDLFYGRVSISLGRHERRSQVKVQGQLLSRSFLCVGLRLQEF